MCLKIGYMRLPDLGPSIMIDSMAIRVTDAASARIRETLTSQDNPEGGLRLGVRGGGCSGLNYVIRFDDAQRAGDRVFGEDGARIFVDLKSLLYLKGTTLDWQGELMQQGFTFLNPNAKNTCSCGISFSV